MRSLQLFILSLALVAPLSAKAEINWSGGASWRFLIQEKDDGLGAKDANGKSTSESTYKAHQLRADINASETGDLVDWGVGFRTSGSSSTSEWVSLHGGQDRAFNLENAYARLHKEFWSSDWAVTVGRQKTVILYDSLAQALWDKDNRWDGFGWTWQHDNFGFNMAQYYLGARDRGTFGSSSFTETEATEKAGNSGSNFGTLLSFQPHLKIRLSDEVQGVLAAGYHVWSGTQGSNYTPAFSNDLHGGTGRSSNETIGPNGNLFSVTMDNARQWQVYTDWSLPWNLRFVGEYIQNKKVYYGSVASITSHKAQTGALALSLAYGKAKKAGDFSLSYSYVRKGLASVLNTFTNSNMPADNIGHLIDGKVAVADGFVLGSKVEIYREKAKVGGDGLAMVAPNQNRKQSQDRFEFYTGVSF